MARVNSHLWASRPWNTDTGRLVWWLRQHRKTGSYTSRRAVLAFYLIAVKDAGEVATLAAVKAAGLTLPAWLEKPAQQGPGPATGESLEQAA